VSVKLKLIFLIVVFVAQMAANGQGLLLCWYLLFGQPGTAPNRITGVEFKNKSSIEFGQPEPLLMANKKMKTYSSASIAANPMLGVRAL